MQTTIQPYGDNFAIVIPVEYLLHTQDKPFCWDSTCGCHSDQTLYLEVRQFVTDGLMTPDEAVLFLTGRTV